MTLRMEEGAVPCPFVAVFAEMTILKREMTKAPTKHGSDVVGRTRVMKLVFESRGRGGGCWRERCYSALGC